MSNVATLFWSFYQSIICFLQFYQTVVFERCNYLRYLALLARKPPALAIYYSQDFPRKIKFAIRNSQFTIQNSQCWIRFHEKLQFTLFDSIARGPLLCPWHQDNMMELHASLSTANTACIHPMIGNCKRRFPRWVPLIISNCELWFCGGGWEL